MGLAERKEREKLELKNLILEASRKLLLAHGQEGLSIRKIADEVEYSPATIYLYFADKDAILHELMEMGFGVMNEYMKDSFIEKDPIATIQMVPAPRPGYVIRYNDQLKVYEEVREIKIQEIQPIKTE
jgi:AcrR family transcriptional regulator